MVLITSSSDDGIPTHITGRPHPIMVYPFTVSMCSLSAFCPWNARRCYVWWLECLVATPKKRSHGHPVGEWFSGFELRPERWISETAQLFHGVSRVLLIVFCMRFCRWSHLQEHVYLHIFAYICRFNVHIHMVVISYIQQDRAAKLGWPCFGHCLMNLDGGIWWT